MLRERTIRFDILTVFLFLIAICSLSTISFTYSKNAKSILEFSKQSIERASSLVIERIDSLVNDAERLSEMSIHLLLNPKNISVQNKELVSHMFNIVKFYPNLYSLYFATPDGSFIEVVNLSFQTPSGKESDILLEKGAAYGLRVIDRRGEKRTDTWYDMDQKFQVIASRSVPTSDQYDPRARAWYQGASQTKGPYWTDIYEYSLFREKGISVSQALFNEQGGVVAVAGSDLSLAFLSRLLQELVVGKHGQAFILDRSNQVVIPSTEKGNRISHAVVSAAAKAYEQEKKNDFVFEEENVKYLAAVHQLPSKFSAGWQVLIVVPVDDFFANLLKTQHQVVWISVIIAVFTALCAIYFSKRISVPIVKLAEEAVKIQGLDFTSDERLVSSIKEIILMERSFHGMRVALRSFSRYVPKEIVRQLVAKGQELAIGGEKQEITILFSDITGFTKMAEMYPTEMLLSSLAEYFDALSKILLNYGGTIDKYLGDGMMVFWGAPLQIEDQAKKACLAALACQKEINRLNNKNKKEGKPLFETRFGINKGAAIVGNIGTAERMNYTAMGDAVNIASKLQPTNKVYHTSIIISEEVQKELQGSCLVRPLDEVALRGKKEKTKIYELMAPFTESTEKQKSLCKRFSEMVQAVDGKDFKKAEELLSSLAADFPEDGPIQIYQERLKK